MGLRHIQSLGFLETAGVWRGIRGVEVWRGMRGVLVGGAAGRGAEHLNGGGSTSKDGIPLSRCVAVEVDKDVDAVPRDHLGTLAVWEVVGKDPEV